MVEEEDTNSPGLGADMACPEKRWEYKAKAARSPKVKPSNSGKRSKTNPTLKKGSRECGDIRWETKERGVKKKCLGERKSRSRCNEKKKNATMRACVGEANGVLALGQEGRHIPITERRLAWERKLEKPLAWHKPKRCYRIGGRVTLGRSKEVLGGW